MANPTIYAHMFDGHVIEFAWPEMLGMRARAACRMRACVGRLGGHKHDEVPLGVMLRQKTQ